MTTQEEVCEDLNSGDCDQTEIELSEAVATTWRPVVVGRPVALFYIDGQGELYFHSFAGDVDLAELLGDMNGDELAPPVLAAVRACDSLVLTDPEDDFTILTNLTVTDLGLETP